MTSRLWDALVGAKLSRRGFLAASGLAALSAAQPERARALQQEASTAAAPLRFEPLRPSNADELLVPSGFRHQVILRWNDPIGEGLRFGNDPDFLAWFPIDVLDHGFDLTRGHGGFIPTTASSGDGLLVVNHEFFDPRFLHGPSWRERSAARIALEQTQVGLSVVRLHRRDAWWSVAPDHRLSRRYDARSPMLLTGPAASLDGGPAATGTLANCSGGVTPWGTVLSCEENFQNFVDPRLGWDRSVYGRRHYGWVVEIDPFDPAAVPRKHTALGRFRHENIALRVANDGTVVAYLGDDKHDSCVFKFIADRKLSEARNRTANLRILEAGQLYAADFAGGRWIPIPATSEALSDASAAAIAAGATPVDRPEDLEIDPLDGSVMIAMTNNAAHGNFHGHMIRLVEASHSPAARTFDWSIAATGGPQSGFSSPDNLLFDDHGNLWMCTDVADESVGRGIYSFMGNNSMFQVAREGRGEMRRFASGPVECELTGPCFTPDGSTLFLSIQHPGGSSEQLEKSGPSSHWPDGGDAIPRGAVVAITGFPPRR